MNRSGTWRLIHDELEQGLLVATVLHGDYSNTFATGGNARTQIFMVVILGFVAASESSILSLLGAQKKKKEIAVN